MQNNFGPNGETVSLDRVLKALDPVKRLKLVILDACRDNPFAKTMKRSVASRSIGRGLAQIEPTMSDTLIAFAAKAGAVASDGDGQNSPFATALLHNLGTPDLDLRQMLFNVQDEVDRSTGGKQRPELSISLVGQYKLKPATAAPANKETLAAPPVDEAAHAWPMTRDTTSQAVLEDFIRQFGNTVYGSMASARLEEFRGVLARLIPGVVPGSIRLSVAPTGSHSSEQCFPRIACT